MQEEQMLSLNNKKKEKYSFSITLEKKIFFSIND